MKIRIIFALVALMSSFCSSVIAEISVSPFLVFMQPGNLVQNIVVTNNDSTTAYVEVTEQLVQNPGNAKLTLESFQPGDNPADFGLLTTPLKLALAANSQRTIRVSSLKGSTASDQLYYLTIAPVTMAPASTTPLSSAKIDLDIDIGYVVKILILPPNPQPIVSAIRKGTTVTIENTGNSYISLRNGELCNINGNHCVPLSTDTNYHVLFAGNTWSFSIPQTGIVKFNGTYAEDKSMNVNSN